MYLPEKDKPYVETAPVSPEKWCSYLLANLRWEAAILSLFTSSLCLRCMWMRFIWTRML